MSLTHEPASEPLHIFVHKYLGRAQSPVLIAQALEAPLQIADLGGRALRGAALLHLSIA